MIAWYWLIAAFSIGAIAGYILCIIISNIAEQRAIGRIFGWY
jgi:hypothetical protein